MLRRNDKNFEIESREAKMDYVKTLLENRNVLRESGSLSLGDHEVLAAFDEDGNMIAVGKAWTYLSETGMMMSEFFEDGSLREESCGEKQKIEMLYLLPDGLSSEQDSRGFALENNAFPLPLAYSVSQIVCQDHVFMISSTAGNPSICGSYQVIATQLSSAAHSYYTRGLASNVLERYYYEFLPESHQLYLDEEQLKREMKERKKHTKDSKKNKIIEENFQKDTDGTFNCEQKVKLWGVTTMLYADFYENPEYKEWTLTAYIHQLNTHIQWIDTHEKEIEQELLNHNRSNYNMVEWANFWMEGQEVVDEDGQSYYELEDGGHFPCPITEQSFLDSLYIGGVHITSDSPRETSIELFLDTDPPFFADHSIEVFIDADMDIQKTSQPNAKYRIQVNGLAG